LNVSTVAMLPDDKHLFVSAGGAGYIIEAKSRTLVERTGTLVFGTMQHHPLTTFVIIHDGTSLEAFGKNGRLWKTDPIGFGQIRRLAFTDDERLVGETPHLTRTGWTRFFVKLATGEVQLDPTGVLTE
jgi:hypothetical protein